MIQDSG
jgi:transposase-like protein